MKGHIFKGRHRTIYTVTNMITDISSNVLQLLHHLADPLGDLLAHIVLDQRHLGPVKKIEQKKP